MGHKRPPHSVIYYSVVPKRLSDDVAISFMRTRGLEPLEPYINSTTRWRSRCLRCSNETYPRLGDLRSGKSIGGCQFCAGNRPLDPLLAEQLLRDAGFEPLESYKNVDQGWRAKCIKCGNEGRPSITGIKSGTGCGWCNGQFPDMEKIIKKMGESSLEPLEPYSSNKALWKCRCTKCDRIVFPKYNNIDNGWGGCGVCAGVRVDAEIAQQKMIEADLIPQVPYPGNQTQWECIHTVCGRTVLPMYITIKNGSGGCKFCAISGLKWDVPTVVYFLANSWFQKIGVANNDTLNIRLKKHQRWGLQLKKCIQFETGELAYQLEQSVITWWREDLGAPAIARDELPDGWTETVENARVSVDETMDYLRVCTA
jgi:hypothetical protein